MGSAVLWGEQGSRIPLGKSANIRSVTPVRRKPGGKAPPLFRNIQTQEKSPAGIEKEADMKTTSAISTAALSALMLVGLSSRAQEATTPTSAPASSDNAAPVRNLPLPFPPTPRFASSA